MTALYFKTNTHMNGKEANKKTTNSVDQSVLALLEVCQTCLASVPQFAKGELFRSQSRHLLAQIRILFLLAAGGYACQLNQLNVRITCGNVDLLGMRIKKIMKS